MINRIFTRFLPMMLAMIIVFAGPLSADIYIKKTESGAVELTDQRVDESYRVILESKISEDYDLPSMEELEQSVKQASDRFDIPKTLIFAMITIESAGQKDAESHKGAIGLMQLMPGTAKEMGVEDPRDPHQNIMGGTKYLQKMLNRYDGDLTRALAAYNAGPGNVEKHNGIPPFEETKKFVKSVREAFGQFRRESDMIYTYYDERGVLHVTNIH